MTCGTRRRSFLCYPLWSDPVRINDGYIIIIIKTLQPYMAYTGFCDFGDCSDVALPTKVCISFN